MSPCLRLYKVTTLRLNALQTGERGQIVLQKPAIQNYSVGLGRRIVTKRFAFTECLACGQQSQDIWEHALPDAGKSNVV